MTQTSEQVPAVVAPDEVAHQAVLDHGATCTACRMRDDGGYCQVAARLVREAREARR